MTRTDLSRSLKIKDNGAIWNLIYHFLSIINSNSVVILNRFGDIGHWKPVWPGLTFQGPSRSQTMVPNVISYMSSYPSPIITVVILNRFGDIGDWKTCVTRTDLSRSLKIKDNGAIWNLIYDFLSITNSNSLVILNRFGDIGHFHNISETFKNV